MSLEDDKKAYAEFYAAAPDQKKRLIRQRYLDLMPSGKSSDHDVIHATFRLLDAQYSMHWRQVVITRQPPLVTARCFQESDLFIITEVLVEALVDMLRHLDAHPAQEAIRELFGMFTKAISQIEKLDDAVVVTQIIQHLIFTTYAMLSNFIGEFTEDTWVNNDYIDVANSFDPPLFSDKDSLERFTTALMENWNHLMEAG